MGRERGGEREGRVGGGRGRGADNSVVVVGGDGAAGWRGLSIDIGCCGCDHLGAGGGLCVCVCREGVRWGHTERINVSSILILPWGRERNHILRCFPSVSQEREDIGVRRRRGIDWGVPVLYVFECMYV